MNGGTTQRRQLGGLSADTCGYAWPLAGVRITLRGKGDAEGEKPLALGTGTGENECPSRRWRLGASSLFVAPSSQLTIARQNVVSARPKRKFGDAVD